MISPSEIEKYPDLKRVLLLEKDVCAYLLPHQVLRPYISNYTISFPKNWLPETGDPEDYTVLPHGSATLVAQVREDGMHFVLMGPATEPNRVGSNMRLMEFLVIIEFQPAGLFALTGISQTELTDQTLPLDALDPMFQKKFALIVLQSASVKEMVTELDQLLYQMFKYPIPAQTRATLHEIIRFSGVKPISQLSQELHYSERQLGRLFNQHIGTSPKKFSRIVRVNYALRLLSRSQRTIETIAGLAGYHDPSHFVKDFKAVCGITPLEFRLQMTNYYNETNKFS